MIPINFPLSRLTNSAPTFLSAHHLDGVETIDSGRRPDLASFMRQKIADSANCAHELIDGFIVGVAGGLPGKSVCNAACFPVP